MAFFSIAKADLAELDAVQKITALPEYVQFQKAAAKAGSHVQIDSGQPVSSTTDASPGVTLPAWRIEVFEARPDHRTRWQSFLISVETGAIYVYDVVNDKYITLKAWRTP